MFVYFRRAVTSLARKFSPFPTPTTSGLSFRAATTSCRSLATTANAYVPSTLRRADLTASTSSPPPSSPSTRCANVSVSVSELNSCPSATSESRSSRKLLIMPLWTIATLSMQPSNGCAFSEVGFPWVAQRVCAIPTVPSISGMLSSSTDISPFVLKSWMLSPTTARPAES